MPREASSAALRQFVDLGGGKKKCITGQDSEKQRAFQIHSILFFLIGFYNVKSEKHLHLTRQVQPDVD